MRTTIAAALLCAASVASAQGATVTGQVVLKDGGQPLGYTTISVLTANRQQLTGDVGKFTLTNLPAGELRLRFKRIGFAPKDTTLILAANDAPNIRIEMVRLAIQLPAMLVSGKCTNESPFAAKSPELAVLFEQINQNAERVRLLSNEKPFFMYVFRVQGYRGNDNRLVPTAVDTIVRRPMPPSPYLPKSVIRRGQGEDADNWLMALPELPNFADTAFTNNHCFRYAGQTRWESDSVIKVDYEPVPWLAKEVDIEGSMYLRVSDYQLVATITKLNRMPPAFRMAGMEELSVRARFSEIVTGIPVLDEWELTRRFHKPTLPRVEVGQVFRLQWADSTALKTDTLRLFPRLR